MTLFPPWGDLPTYATVAQALTFFHVEDDAWKKCRGRLDSVAVLPDGSPLNVGLVWRLARRVMAHLAGTRESEDVDVEVWLDNPPGSNDASTRTTPTTSSVHGGTSIC